MVQRIIIMTLMFSCCLMFLGVAEETAEVSKIGVVDIQKITDEAKMVKEAIGEMEQALAKKKDAADKKAEQYQKLKQEFDQQSLVLTEEQREKKRKELRQLQLEIEDVQYDINRLLEKQNKEIVTPAMDKILAAVEEVGKAKGLDLVLPLDVVLYHSGKCDVTGEVISRLNQAHKEAKDTKN